MKMSDINEVLSKLSQIDGAIKNSSALNGGFDALVEDIKDLRTDLHEVKNSLQEIKDTVNHPDTGVISRIRDLESEQSRRMPLLDKLNTMGIRYDDLLPWRDDTEKRLDHLVIQNTQLENWQKSATRLIWILGGTVGSLFVKMLWELMFKV
jgi:DNA repair ATPase RecN